MRRTEAARALGVHADTLVRFERRGLIKPARDFAGHRRYTAEDIETLRALVYPPQHDDEKQK